MSVYVGLDLQIVIKVFSCSVVVTQFIALLTLFLQIIQEIQKKMQLFCNLFVVALTRARGVVT